jgi:hypothetical protein
LYTGNDDFNLFDESPIQSAKVLNCTTPSFKEAYGQSLSDKENSVVRKRAGIFFFFLLNGSVFTFFKVKVSSLFRKTES